MIEIGMTINLLLLSGHFIVDDLKLFNQNEYEKRTNATKKGKRESGLRTKMTRFFLIIIKSK